MFYLVPPAGTPITFSDIFHIIKIRLSSDSMPDVFESMIKNQFKAKHCFLYNSGRSALTSTLRSLRKLAGNKKIEVVIPAYTCFSVAAAIARSGLKIRLVDIDPHTLDYDYEKLQSLNFNNVLAIIGCNLFGILSDWNNLKNLAIEKKVYLIDDAAQSMGSQFQKKNSGSLGDVGFFSLGRGKNLSTVSGGVLLTDNDDIAMHLYNETRELKKDRGFVEIKSLLNIILYALLLNPRLYWLPDNMPFLKLGQTIFDVNFDISGLSYIQKCAGVIIFPKLENINAVRLKNAKAICDGLLKDDRYNIPGYSPDNCPSYLRLPVLAQNNQDREKSISSLNRAGIKSSAMYPSSIRQIAGIENYLASSEDDFKGAQTVVDQLFTLPTNHFVKNNDIDKIVNCLMGNIPTQ